MQDMSDILLSTMFEFIELVPKEKFEFNFEEKSPLKVGAVATSCPRS